MKKSFYPKLAIDGIKKNKRLYFPYILTGMVMVMMSYIISFLSASEMLEHMEGGSTLRMILPLGSVVIGVFSLIFMFYSNSFIIRQRNKEFGLYNVLGMDKGNLGRIICWESLFVSIISIIGGLIFGIAFSKLAELIMYNLLSEKTTYTLQIDFISAGKVSLLFAGIYFLLLLKFIIKVCRSNPLELMRSGNTGEKPPKANWLSAVAGVIILAIAYYIAVSIKNPLSAIVWFMVAVIMVIVATYMLFVAGSVAFCRILQKNKKYYYKSNHFVSVSSMVYRMKRNGSGLASICVLVTMVMVMLSATMSMYIGAEDSFATRYPKDISIRLGVPDIKYFDEKSFEKMRDSINELAPERENVLEMPCISVAGLFTEEGMIIDQESHAEFDISTYDNIGYVQIITLEDYNRAMGVNESLEKDECFIYCYRTEYLNDTFTIENCMPLRVKEVLDKICIPNYMVLEIVPMVVIVTSDIETLAEPLLSIKNSWDNSVLQMSWNYDFDIDGDADEEKVVYNKIDRGIPDIAIHEESGDYNYGLVSRATERSEFFGMYAGLLFMGILLSMVFLFATVLIIYYKQITEGYEDHKRFEIMQKIGMTTHDIRRSVNSQVLTVFFLPLLLAGLHLAFAFPILWKLLQMFGFSNMELMIGVTAVSYAVFAVVYVLVYKITSNVYYGIVSGGRK